MSLVASTKKITIMSNGGQIDIMDMIHSLYAGIIGIMLVVINPYHVGLLLYLNCLNVMEVNNTPTICYSNVYLSANNRRFK